VRQRRESPSRIWQTSDADAHRLELERFLRFVQLCVLGNDGDIALHDGN
jgi:hypothetical protein